MDDVQNISPERLGDAVVEAEALTQGGDRDRRRHISEQQKRGIAGEQAHEREGHKQNSEHLRRQQRQPARDDANRPREVKP